MAHKGVTQQEEVRSNRRKRDSRRFGQKYQDFFKNYDSAVIVLIIIAGIVVFAGFIFSIPLSVEFIALIYFLAARKYYNFDKQSFDFPYRVPKLAKIYDGSYSHPKLGEGITFLGNEIGTKQQIYSSDPDLRAHQLVFGTTGSGKTELILGLCVNALVQNTGFLLVDGKGDAKLMKDIFRLARTVGREDDLLLINFITSGRDFLDKQEDKITNNINLMSTASSGMLIETIVGLMDDAGGGNDMWKGRAIAFVAALTRPLCYLRDKGFLLLSAEIYLHYFEMSNLEALVYEPEKLFDSSLDKDEFERVGGALKSYIVNLPGYNSALYAQNKRQDQKTVEQHGFITMQLTRVFNDLTYNYAHIFKTEVGDVDFYDAVLNRRLLVTLLPSSERSPDSLKMIGKLILGNIKQMMAGCLGNRVEGQVRTIINSRPTNAPVPFYIILDEYGYYTVVGFANLAAQARSLGFSITFASQDFSSLRRTNAEEADSTWENTNVRMIGRITSGSESETWRRVNGAAGSAYVASISSFERETGLSSDKLYAPDSVGINKSDRLDYDDLAGQENGEFTFIIGKKGNQGKENGVRVIRGMSFYVAGPEPKEMRINDLVPVLRPEKADIAPIEQIVKGAVERMESPTVSRLLISNQYCKSTSALIALMSMYEHMNQDTLTLNRQDQSLTILYWLQNRFDKPIEFGTGGGSLFSEANQIDTSKLQSLRDLFNQVVNNTISVADIKKSAPPDDYVKNMTISTGETIDLEFSNNDEISTDTFFDTEDTTEDLAENFLEDLPENPDTNSLQKINLIDPVSITFDDIDGLYSSLNTIELFKSITGFTQENTLQIAETQNDIFVKDQIRILDQLTEENTDTKTLRSTFERADRLSEQIQNTIKEQTTYKRPSILNTELIDTKAIIEDAQRLSVKLKEETKKNKV